MKMGTKEARTGRTPAINTVLKMLLVGLLALLPNQSQAEGMAALYSPALPAVPLVGDSSDDSEPPWQTLLGVTKNHAKPKIGIFPLGG